MASPTPPRSVPGIRPHPRGVTLDENPPPAHVIINVYGDCGERVMTELCHVSWFDDELEQEMWASLDKRCPIAQDGQCASCPLAERRSTS